MSSFQIVTVRVNPEPAVVPVTVTVKLVELVTGVVGRAVTTAVQLVCPEIATRGVPVRLREPPILISW